MPTGNLVDAIDGIEATLIDSGMPHVILRATDLGITGEETPAELEMNGGIQQKLERIRLRLGPMMNLGDVAKESRPKMTMISLSQVKVTMSTRTFIRHRCHQSIGVLGAASVAEACLTKGAIGRGFARLPNAFVEVLSIGHPSGEMTIVAHLDTNANIVRIEVLCTARKLMDSIVFSG